MAMPTCTVTVSATGEKCGLPAVYSEGEFAECRLHADEHGSLYNTQHMIASIGEVRVGDEVKIHRYGRTYIGTVVEVGKRGAVYAEFFYNNGTRRRVRV